MTQLKQITKKLKSNNYWKAYKNKFKNNQMKLATTKIALIFNKEIDAETFYELEKDLIKTKKDEDMFKETFTKFEKEVEYKADWESFGKFMWYQYQTSTYYNDIKSGTKNIFSEKNMIKVNEVKRGHYLKWLHSIDKSDDLFNEKIIEVSKIIL